MRYYWVKENKNYTLAPQIKNWFSALDIRKLKPGYYKDIPKRMLFYIEENPNTIFTDILVSPFFLVSEKIKDCLQLFEPNLEFKEFILLDQRNRRAQEYFLPQLSEMSCLTANSQFNLDRSRLKYIELDQESIKEKAIFTLGEVKSRYVIARLDVIEGMLRRNVKGLCIEEVYVKNAIGGRSNGRGNSVSRLCSRRKKGRGRGCTRIRMYTRHYWRVERNKKTDKCSGGFSGAYDGILFDL